MSALTCPHPQRCAGARTHRAGSAAARRCASARPAPAAALAGAPPAPLQPTSSQEDWTSGIGQIHPSGGYDTMRQNRSSVLGGQTTYTRDGITHREDGPAEVVTNANGSLRAQTWKQEGLEHRGDGPATVFFANGVEDEALSAYYLRGVEVGWGEASTSAVQAALAAGADPATVVGWLAVDPDLHSPLIAAGVEPGEAARCIDVGVLDAPSIIEVAAGRLPISWAAAGKGGRSR